MRLYWQKSKLGQAIMVRFAEDDERAWLSIRGIAIGNWFFGVIHGMNAGGGK